MPILEHFVDRTPGSFIEEKRYALVWHYRVAEPEFGGCADTDEYEPHELPAHFVHDLGPNGIVGHAPNGFDWFRQERKHQQFPFVQLSYRP